MSDLKTLLSEVSRFVPTLDLADPAAAEASLNERFPPQGEVVLKIIESARAEAEAEDFPEVRHFLSFIRSSERGVTT